MRSGLLVAKNLLEVRLSRFNISDLIWLGSQDPDKSLLAFHLYRSVGLQNVMPPGPKCVCEMEGAAAMGVPAM